MYSYQLYFRDFCELIKRSASTWLDNSVVRALHRYRRGHGLESRSVLTYFSGFLHATPPQVAYIIGLIFHCLKMFHQTSSITTWMTLDRKVGGWLKHRIRVLLFVTNPVEDSDFLFVPRSWHADYFIFTFVSPSLKFTVFHSFTIQYDLDIADPSSMQYAYQLWK